jgi:hypothetical protein
LDLNSVSFHDMENLMRLISGCPILENSWVIINSKNNFSVIFSCSINIWDVLFTKPSSAIIWESIFLPFRHFIEA